MAMYSASVKVISRSSGRSATAAAAYRIGEKITDQRTGELHDFTRKQGIESVSMHLPAGVEPMTSETLWNAAEWAEKRKNSTVARELLVALPYELSPDNRFTLAESIAKELVQRYQVAAQVAVHLPDREGDQRNHHAHILFTTRRISQDGLGGKTRELDDLKQGPQEVLWIREMVERRTNTALAAEGLDVQVDRRSLVDQRKAALAAGDQVLAHILDRDPTLHEGPRVTQIRRECARHSRAPLGLLDRMAANEDVSAQKAIRIELAQVEAQIIDLETERTKRRAKAREARLYWLQREIDATSAMQGSVEIERRVITALQERYAQASTDLVISANHSHDMDWLAKLWRSAVLEELTSVPVLGAAAKRKLAQMLDVPLPADDNERRRQWQALSETICEAEAAEFDTAERVYEAQSHVGGRWRSEDSLVLAGWHAVRQARADAIEAMLQVIYESPARGAEIQVEMEALRDLLAQVRALTPDELSVEALQKAAANEREMLSRIRDLLDQQVQISYHAIRPGGPRLG